MDTVTRALQRRSLLAACALLLIGCTAADDERFTEQDLELLLGMALNPRLSPPVDVSNDLVVNGDAASRKALADLGQQLFFDTGLAPLRADGAAVSCADCHTPSEWFSDPRGENHVSRGQAWTTRNSPSVVNVGYYTSFGWDGRSDSLWGQGRHAYLGERTMGGTTLLLAQQLARRYEDRYLAVFKKDLPDELKSDGINRFNPPPMTPRDPMSEAELEAILQDVLKAWSAYELRLVSGNAPFDDFARGDHTALTPAQQRGLHLFLGKAGCITCHNGPLFTDNLFHSVGLQQNGVNVPGEDLGRYTGLKVLAGSPYKLSTPPAPTEDDKGRFRTKGLRQVAQTAPYFHAGQAASLTDVVWFYNQGGEGGGTGKPSPYMVPLGLSEPEQADLVLFLGSLTGEPVPANLACNNARPSGVDGGYPNRCAVVP